MIRSIPFGTSLGFGVVLMWLLGPKPSRHQVVILFVPFPPKVAPDFTKEEKKMLKRSDFVKIEPGEFLMGSPDDEPGRQSNETLHKVKITKPYYLGVSEVTIAEWNRLQPKALQKDDPFFSDEFNERSDQPPQERISRRNERRIGIKFDERVFTVEILEKIVPLLERKYEAAKKAEKGKQTLLGAAEISN